LLKDENKMLKDARDVFQDKLDDVYRNHILISKQDGNSSKPSHEEEELRHEFKAMDNIQEEVRKLHF